MKNRMIERHMFYGANKKIFLRAIDLRKNMTVAEENLWNILNDKKLFKVRWKRQHPIDIFIVDFYCHKYKLVVEVDGEIHLDEEVKEHGDGREHDIEKLGIKILRFTNREVFEEIEFVKSRILHEISTLQQIQNLKSPL